MFSTAVKKKKIILIFNMFLTTLSTVTEFNEVVTPQLVSDLKYVRLRRQVGLPPGWGGYQHNHDIK